MSEKKTLDLELAERAFAEKWNMERLVREAVQRSAALARQAPKHATPQEIADAIQKQIGE